MSIYAKACIRLASFPGPAQLFITITALFRTASDGKLGGAWERGYIRHNSEFRGENVTRLEKILAYKGTQHQL